MAAALGVELVEVTTSPPFLASLGLAGLVSLFVLWVNREVLELDQMFPEVMRVPGARFFVGKRRSQESPAGVEAGRGAGVVVPPADGP